ncbi:prepilin-type N-terminal cleavage/methylation domain-containing protein [Poriferisphaera corsica]|nr:prepilin-type N-terminal cleavage/methylation domain-containing protein [Poriferisphaera corsica]
MKDLRKARERFGFTLIELLVVISIIALLIGILLPALGAARQTAQKAVCLANLRSSGQGLAIYGSSNRDWTPGPNTSGFHLNDGSFDDGEDNGSTAPIQNFDWISPTMGESIGLSDDAATRMEDIFTNSFRCPANDSTYDSQYGSGITPPNGVTDLLINSYSAINQFMLIKSNAGDNKVYTAWWVEDVVEIPDNFDSRQDLVGNASSKVWTLDGARYLDNNKGTVTFNAHPRQYSGGNYGTWGPALGNVVRTGNPYKLTTEQDKQNAERLSYRHNGSLNASFFDGHAESMDQTEAQRVEHYFPSGSVVRDAAALNDDSVENGMRIN